MKQLIMIWFVPIVLLFFTGCESLQTSSLLSDKQKYEVYHKVLNEIEYHKNRGDSYYKNGYLNAAIQSYEKVNFYENKKVYSEKYIAKIQSQAKVNGWSYYQKAQAVLKKDKLQAVYFLNKMRQNDNTIEEAIKLLHSLYADVEVKDILTKKENTILTLLKNNDGDVNFIVSLNKALDDLNQYNDQSEAVYKGKNVIDSQHRRLIQNTIRLYNEKKYDHATKDFRALQLVYKEDKTIGYYLDLITLQENIQKSKSLLANNNHKEALDIAKNMQKRFPENQEIKSIIDTSLKFQCSSMQKFLHDGIKLYSEQKLDNAKEKFQAILECDSSHKIAHTYIKKINQQLATIEKLR